MPPSLWSISQQIEILVVLDPEDGSTMILRNIGNYLPVRKAYLPDDLNLNNTPHKTSAMHTTYQQH